MTSILVGTAVLAVINFGYKAAGPALLTDREPSPALSERITALAPALLAGLITVELAGHRWSHFDWTVVPALVVAAVAYLRGAPQLLCVAVAVLVTAGLRLIVG